MAHLLTNLGWVDFDLDCTTLCLGKLAEVAEQVGKMVEHPKFKVIPTQFRQEMGHPIVGNVEKWGGGQKNPRNLADVI